ncbi:MAG: class I SAM-dependent methyltransferase [Anaerolineales bacterium]
MTTTLRKLKAWWIIITQMGPIARLAQQLDELIRYYVLNTLTNEGFFDYLQKPRTYNEILAGLGFIDDAYTRDLLKILTTDKRNVLIEKDGLYQLNPDQSFPTLDEVLARTDARYHNLTHYMQGMVHQMPARLHGKPVEFSQSVDLLGRQLSERLDQALNNRIYTAMRNAIFAFLTQEDRAWLRGKALLDVGCGSGREPAELWLRLGGDVRITAIEPTSVMLERAIQNFPTLLQEISPNHPPLTDANSPIFQQADATRLPFDDNSFDAAFYSQVLHWTPNPRQAIGEIVRVVRPGGLIFGVQGGKPQSDPYMDIVIRTDQNCNGFFWMDEYQRWYAEHDISVEITTPAGVFRARKPK